MKRRSTEVDTLYANTWGIGDILEGKGDNTTHRIIITGIGINIFTCQWYKLNDKLLWEKMNDETGTTTLQCRDWKWVANIFDESYIILNNY